MNATLHRRIKSLIEDTNDAYGTAFGGMNCDYAEFAAMSVDEFKTALGLEHMTARDLRRLLRRAGLSHRKTAPKACWATFMAHYVAYHAGANDTTGRAVN